MTIQHVFSTSAAKAYLDCPRKRWLQYHAPNGTATGGLERTVMSVALSTGIYVHNGLASLLQENALEDVIDNVLADYYEECHARRLEVEAGSEWTYTMDEQAALIEAQLRGAAIVLLPRLLADYDVIDIEREETVQMASTITFMSRADAVLRRKTDKALFVLNWKTVGGAGDWWAKRFEYDVQTLSECVGIEQRLGERVAGVLIVGLDKGKRMPPSDREKEMGVTQYRQASPLIYGYKTDANPPATRAMYQVDYTRAKGWKRFPVWDDPDGMTVKRWIDDVVPRETLEAQFVQLPPIMRQDAHVDAWRRQTLAREARIERDVRVMKEHIDNDYPETPFVLDALFEQNSDACVRFGPCPMLSICWDAQVATDPIGSGLFRARRPHHSYEVALTTLTEEVKENG